MNGEPRRFDKRGGATATDGRDGRAPLPKEPRLSQSALRSEPEINDQDDQDDQDDRFSLEEGPSFCSRPTPVTPAPEALRRFGEEGVSIERSGIVPFASPRPDSLPPSADNLDHAFFSEPKLSLPPSLPPPMMRRPASRARTAVSLMLFVTLFGGVAALLCLAVLQKLGVAPATVLASFKAFVANVLG